MGLASLLLGILSIFVWPIVYLGLPVGMAGVVLGILAFRKKKKAIGIVGIVLSGIGLGLTVVNITFGLLDLILKTYFQV